jgi:hypothetical protein
MSDLFDRFWEVYPNKKAKGQAIRTFDKLKITEELLNEIIEAIDLQKQEREIKEDRCDFVPPWKNPSTWLRAECWLDEIDLRVNNEDSKTNFKKESTVTRSNRKAREYMEAIIRQNKASSCESVAEIGGDLRGQLY